MITEHVIMVQNCQMLDIEILSSPKQFKLKDIW